MIIMIKKIKYIILLKLFKVLKIDTNNLKIDRYRSMEVEIGENCRIFTNFTFSEGYLVHIGNNVTISTDVKILTHDNSISKFLNNTTDLVGKVFIGDNCFIGAGSIILPGVTIEEDCLVAAGSVVTRSFKRGTIIAGNPARAIMDIDTFINKNQNRAFNFKNHSSYEKKIAILNSNENLIKKKY